jgi:hypothetical protein
LSSRVVGRRVSLKPEFFFKPAKEFPHGFIIIKAITHIEQDKSPIAVDLILLNIGVIKILPKAVDPKKPAITVITKGDLTFKSEGCTVKKRLAIIVKRVIRMVITDSRVHTKSG